MAVKIAFIILLISLPLIAENGNSAEPAQLNLTLTTPYADFFSSSDFSKEGKTLIYFRNATLYLNNSSVNLNTRHIKSGNATIKSEMAALLSKNAITNLSDLTVEMESSTLSLSDGEISSKSSNLKTLNSNIHLDNSRVSFRNGTLAINMPADSYQESTANQLRNKINLIDGKKTFSETVPLNLILTLPDADLYLANSISKLDKTLIHFRNATLYLNNSSVDLSTGCINSKITTIRSETATLISKNIMTNLSNVTAEMENSSLGLWDAELKSNQCRLTIIDTNFSINNPIIGVPNGTLAVIMQTPTDQNNLVEKWNASVTAYDENWITPFFSILDTLTKPFVFILFILVLWRLRKYLLSFSRLGRKDLVFDKMINSSGDETLDKRLEGISQSAREELINNISIIQEIIEKHANEQGLHCAREFLPLPNEIPRSSLGEILSSVKDVAPEIWKPIIPLISILFPSRGIRISCILQREGDKTGRLGITIKISDMEDKLEPRIHTVWEPEISSAQTSSLNSIPINKWMQADTLHKIGLLLEDLQLFSDAMQYHKEALGLLGSWKPPEIKMHLESCASKLVELEIASAYYSTGENFRKEKDEDNAVKNYIQALSREDRESGKSAWSAVFKDIKIDSNSAEYRILANLYKKVGLFEEATKLYTKAIERGNKDALRDLKSLNMMRVDLLLSCAGSLQELKRFKDAKKYYEYARKIDPKNQTAKSEIEKLERELASGASLPERYIRLLKPASIWLAAEIRRMYLLQNIPIGAKLYEDTYKSSIYNFFGALNLSYALRYGSDYYKFSHDDLMKAINLSPDWYLPYENLGLWHLLKGHEGLDDKEPLLQLEAIKYYEKAFERIEYIQMPSVFLAEAGKSNIQMPSVFLAEAGKSKVACKDESRSYYDLALYWLKKDPQIQMLKDRIRISEAVSRYLSGDEYEKIKAMCLIECIDPVGKNYLFRWGRALEIDFNPFKDCLKRKYNIDCINNINDFGYENNCRTIKLKKDNLSLTLNDDESRIILEFDDKLNCLPVDRKNNELFVYESVIPSSTDATGKICKWTSARSLYDLACWYEITKAGYPRIQKYSEYAKKRAKICLAYSLARDKNRNLWNLVSQDKDMKSISAKDLENLKFEISRRTELPDLDAISFEKEMNEIFKKINWINP